MRYKQFNIGFGNTKIKMIAFLVFGLALVGGLVYFLVAGAQASRPINIKTISVDSVTADYGPTGGGTTVTLKGDFGETEQVADLHATEQASYIINTDGQLYAVTEQSGGECALLGVGLDYEECDDLGVVSVNQAAAGAIGNDTKIKQVASGLYTEYVLAIDEAGQLYTWGSHADDFGLQVCSLPDYNYDENYCEDNGGTWNPNGYPINYDGKILAPINLTIAGFGAINNGTVLRYLACSDEGACYAVSEQGHVYAWKSNYEGYLGDGTDYYSADERILPIDINVVAAGDIGPTTRIKQITITGTEAPAAVFAVDSDGQVYSWGENEYGLLGLGAPCTAFNYNGTVYTNENDCEDNGGTWNSANDISEALAPINISQRAAGDIDTNANIIQLSAYDRTIVALDSDGQVYTWGNNNDYENSNLGIGPSFGYCSDAVNVWNDMSSEEDCQQPGEWWGDDNGICSDASYYDKASCQSASATWTQGYGDCSANNYSYEYNSQTACNQAGGRWYEDQLCSFSGYTDQAACESTVGVWHDLVPDAYAPININQRAVGDIKSDTKIIKAAGNINAMWAIDDAGQFYIWGGRSSQSFGWYCYGYGQYTTYGECSAAGGDWRQDEYKWRVVTASPINVSATGLGEMPAGTKIDKVIGGYHPGDGEGSMIMVDNNGNGFNYERAFFDHDNFMYNFCSIDATINNRADCESAGGSWEERYSWDELVPVSFDRGFGGVVRIINGASICAEGCSNYTMIDDNGDVFYLDHSNENGFFTPIGQIAAHTAPPYEVTLGGAPCENVVVVDRNTLTCTTTAHVAGLVDVAVTSSDGASSAVLDDGYDYVEIYISINSTGAVDLGAIEPTPAGVLSATSDTVSVKTNNPTGYRMSISTNQPSTNSHASDMAHLSIPSAYLSTTTNSCSWNDTSEILTNTNNALSNNTWGFSMVSTSLSDQKFCQVPSLSSPLVVKSTAAADEVGDETEVYFGARIDLVQVAGKYQSNIVYTAVGNV
jgi:alpha-tubulin suppressor-like RCC1 family protein